MKTLKDIDLTGKTVLVRIDYNVPLKKNEDTDALEVASDLRIRASLPTLNYLRDKGAEKIILISHLGRPEGKIDPAFSLRPVFDRLKNLIDAPTEVAFCEELTTEKITAAVKSLKPSGVLLLENLRFDPGEESDDPTFAKKLVDSIHPDFFVQDGFAVVHRAHASTSAITKLVPSVAGPLVEKELTALEKVKNTPAHPLTIILGGAKVADKQPLIDAFKDSADHILVGGKIAADGFTPKNNNKKIIVATDFDTDGQGRKLDVGPVSAGQFAEIILKSKTVIWNGLLGYAEDPAYATSSTLIAELLGETPDIYSVICGGDTTGFVEDLRDENPSLEYNLVSTGGGAALEYLCGHPLPGIDNLKI